MVSLKSASTQQLRLRFDGTGVLSAKGAITTGQMRWLYERAIMSAVPRNMIEEFMAFEHGKAKLEDHVMGSGRIQM